MPGRRGAGAGRCNNAAGRRGVGLDCSAGDASLLASSVVGSLGWSFLTRLKYPAPMCRPPITMAITLADDEQRLDAPEQRFLSSRLVACDLVFVGMITALAAVGAFRLAGVAQGGLAARRAAARKPDLPSGAGPPGGMASPSAASEAAMRDAGSARRRGSEPGSSGWSGGRSGLIGSVLARGSGRFGGFRLRRRLWHRSAAAAIGALGAAEGIGAADAAGLAQSAATVSAPGQCARPARRARQPGRSREPAEYRRNDRRADALLDLAEPVDDELRAPCSDCISPWVRAMSCLRPCDVAAAFAQRRCRLAAISPY